MRTLIAFLGFAVFGCGGTTGTTINDAAASNEPGGASVSAVLAIDAFGTKTPVTLNAVYVTAVGTDRFWVADSLTAVKSDGIWIKLAAAIPNTIAIGAKLSVGGNAARTAYEAGTNPVFVEDATIIGTPTAPGQAPTPLLLDPAASIIATDDTNYAASYAYNGVLVTLTGPLKVTTLPYVAADNAISLVTNDGAMAFMSDLAFHGYGNSPPALGTCFTTLTGVMDHSTINPRSVADMVVGAGCN